MVEILGMIREFISFWQRVWVGPERAGREQVDAAVTIIQEHLERAAQERGVPHLNVRDLDANQKAALAQDLARLFRREDRIPSAEGSDYWLRRG